MKNRSTKSIFLDLKKLSKSNNGKQKLSFKFESELLDYHSYLKNFSFQHYKLFEELAHQLNLQDSINNLFDGFVCSLEIVDFRFNKNLKEIGAYNLIATNGASEFWIRNSEVFSMNKIDFDDHEVSISFNNQIVGEGNVNKVMKNPLNSALWLINKISLKGEALLKGQFISTGTCTKAHELAPNTKVSANFGELGQIEFNYN